MSEAESPRPPPVLAPLAATPSLRIAITGRETAGKTTLANAILTHAHELPACETLPTDGSGHAQNAYAWAHRFLSSLSHSLPAITARAILRAARPAYRLLFPPYPPCRKLNAAVWPPSTTSTPPTSTDRFRIYDGHGEESALAISNARGVQSDVILFVARLDDARSSREDAAALQMMRLVFGEAVLKRVVVVLTHGCATPPVDLTFEQFVSGRVQTLFRLFDTVFEPVEITPPPSPTAETERIAQTQDDDAGDGGAATDPGQSGEVTAAGTETGTEHEWEDSRFELIAPQLSGVFTEGSAGDANSNSEDGTTANTREQRDKTLNAFSNFILSDENDPNASDGSVTDLPGNFVEVLHDGLIPASERKKYRRLLRPPIVVAELSSSCPRNAEDEALLPDGSAWLPKLIATIGDVAQRARASINDGQAHSTGIITTFPVDEGDGAGDSDNDSDNDNDNESIVHGNTRATDSGGFTQRMKRLLTEVSQSPMLQMLVELTAVALISSIAKEVHDAGERRKLRGNPNGDNNTLLEMPEEDFREVMQDLERNKRIVVYGDMDEEEVKAIGELDEDILRKLERGERRGQSEDQVK